MNHQPPDVRDFVVIGHHVRVERAGSRRWQVWVDEELLDEDFAFSYEAWARGVAESYTRGPVGRGRLPLEADAPAWEGGRPEGEPGKRGS
ncbi:MAG TPA: hypothetical protein VMK42_10075 [Anaeromyxobacteraceae bacterium]|nr:hypothetical protein [Anaeromyxobacteraceae bacterium]